MRTIALAMALLLLPAAVARADDAATAKRLFWEGKSHFGDRSYVEALHCFQAAQKLVKRSSVVIMVARTYRNLDQPDRALSHYKMYREVWKTENPSAASPHRAEVKNQISRLQTILDLVRRGEALQKTQPAAALALFQTALGMSPWPRIYSGMASCHLGLNQPRKAQSPLKAALGYWERYRVNWTSRHPDEAPPDHAEVQRRMVALKKLEQAIQAATARRTTPSPGPAPRPAEQRPAPGTGEPPGLVSRLVKPRPSGLWLVLGITVAALAVTAEALAWVSYGEATDYHEHQPEYDTYRNLTITGHVLASTMAAASAVSFYMYYRSGKPRTASVMMMPGPNGWAVVGRIDF